MNVRFCVASLALLALTGPAAAEQVTITGAVVGPDGTPVADCAVGTLYTVNEETRERAWAETTTDANGSFRLSFEDAMTSGQYDVIARKQGFALGCAEVKPGDEAKLQLGGEPATLSGKISDAQGEPLAGVRVVVHCLAVPDGGVEYFRLDYIASPLQAGTDQEGRFEFGGLPPEAQIGIWVYWEGYAPYYGGDSEGWPRPGDQVAITLQRAATIAGRVLLKGEPVAGVKVFVYSEGAASQAETAEDGSYSFKGRPADTYVVKIVPPEGYAAAARTGLELEAGQHATDVDFELIEGAVVEGTVTVGATGEPAAGAGIRADCRETPAYPDGARADDLGHYVLRLAPGRVRLTCRHGEGESAEGTVPREVLLDLRDGDHETGVDFVVKPPARFAGVVLGPDEQPAAGVKVWLQGRIFTLELPEPVLSDDQGRFELEPERHLARGPWMVFAQDAERGLVALAFLQDRDEEMTLRLEPGAYAAAEVVDEEGNPMPDARVPVWVTYDGVRGHDLPLRMASDEQGHLIVGPLAPGRELNIYPRESTRAMAVDDTWENLRGMTLATGETRQLPPLVLNPAGRTLRGTVVNADEQLVAGARVICRASVSGKLLSVTSDETGRFELAGLKARGDVGVIAMASDGTSAFGMPCDPDVPFEPIFMLEPPGVVEGVVRDAGGEPKPDAQVNLTSFEFGWARGLPGGLKVNADMKTDERGQWRLEGLVPGLKYSVYARDPLARGGGKSEQFVAAGGPEPTVLELRLD